MLSHEVSVWRLSEWLVRLGHYWPVPIDILGFAHIPRELFEHHLPEPFLQRVRGVCLYITCVDLCMHAMPMTCMYAGHAVLCV
jgi:hypothetical protein